MGRFEKRPDNDPRVRGELSRAAETALWAVVEDLESLQQNVLRSFQEEIKKLQTEKDRLTDEVQQLIEEKEHLQEVRRITEQQVLIRQLSEALAKHICSQLQSSLAKIANQTESQIAALKSAQSIGPAIENNEQVEKMLGSLDDNLTIAFNSLQQELKNYQSNLSQQLSRMYNQQQQGETIVEELIDRLRGELTRAIQETSTAKAQLSPPTVLQPPELQPPSSPVVVNLSPPTVLQFPDQQSPNPLQASTPLEETSTTKPSVSITPPEKSTPVTIVPPPQETRPETKSVIPKVSPDSETKLQSSQEKAAEPSSVINRELSAGAAKSPLTPEKPPEPISTSKTKFSPSSEKPPEPVSVLSRDSSASKASTPPPAPVVRRGSTPSSSRSRKSSNLSPVQVGFLLVVLSTVMTALYNVVLKGMFYKTSQLSAMLEVAGLISPTLGNIMLILTLRLMVVVPLMILLAPMMYPQVWQDLQNLKQSLGNNQSGSRSQPQRFVQLMFASGCFLFLSQVLIYLAIGQVPTGVAIALFFVYPLINGVLSWLLFRDRPGVFRASAIGAIFCGEVLVFAGATSTGIGTTPLGSITAILAGAAFACYLILTRVCAAKVHPVSLSLINFVTMLGLSFIFLMIPLPENWSLVVDPSKLLEIVLSAFILGALTLLSYVFSHIGINKLGGLRSAIISASVPILTVILAGLVLQETLNIAQIFGVLFVTFGAIAFGIGKIQNPNKPANAEG